MKCQQIYIHKHNDAYAVTLHTWTKDDTTQKDLNETLSKETLKETNILFLAKLYAAIAQKKYNYTYPCNYSIVQE